MPKCMSMLLVRQRHHTSKSHHFSIEEGLNVNLMMQLYYKYRIAQPPKFNSCYKIGATLHITA